MQVDAQHVGGSKAILAQLDGFHSIYLRKWGQKKGLEEVLDWVILHIRVVRLGNHWKSGSVPGTSRHRSCAAAFLHLIFIPYFGFDSCSCHLLGPPPLFFSFSFSFGRVGAAAEMLVTLGSLKSLAPAVISEGTTTV